MAFCEGCGLPLEEDARFCSSCGRKVPEEGGDTREDGATNPAALVFCATCSAPIPQGSAFCERCGTAVDSASSPSAVSVSISEDIPLPSAEELDAAAAALEQELDAAIKEVLEYNIDAPQDLGESVIARWKD